MNEISRPSVALIAMVAAVTWVGLTPCALGACKIKVVAEINVDTAHNRVVTQGQIDGKPVSVMIDTGGWTTWIWSDAAQRLGLHPTYQGQIRFYGVGGEAQASQTIVKRLQIGTTHANNLQLIVLPSPNRPIGAADMVIGNEFFASVDTEFDLAHGKIRLLRPDGCTIDELPYWTDTYSQADLERASFQSPFIKTRVLVNGKPIEAELDTGTPLSAITRQAAEYAGVTPWVKDPHPAGTMSGIGGHPVETWVDSVDSFSIGDETIRHVPVWIADLFGADKAVRLGSRVPKDVGNTPRMLIGCDFFLAHHLLVLNRQGKLLFTFNGGTVFQVPHSGPAPQSTPGSSSGDGAKP